MSSSSISPGQTPTLPSGHVTTYEQTRRVIDAIKNKCPVPEIDFTIHVMEDGRQVSTRERVCRGTTHLGGYVNGVIRCTRTCIP